MADKKRRQAARRQADDDQAAQRDRGAQLEQHGLEADTDSKRSARARGKREAEQEGEERSRRRVEDIELVAKPDVVLDIPALRVDGVRLSVEQLEAHLSMKLRMAQLLDISVGLDARIDRVELELDAVEAEAQLRASLGRLQQIVNTAFASIQQNPEIFREALGGIHLSERPTSAKAASRGNGSRKSAADEGDPEGP